MLVSITSFDATVVHSLYAIRDDSLVQLFILVSKLGSHYTIFGLALVAAIVLAYRKHWALIAGMFTSVFGSAVAAYVLKELIARPRPDVFMHAYTPSTVYSFPSIHATLAVAFYCFVLWLIYDIRPTARKYITFTAVAVLVMAIGFSRLYLGVHYLSDVIAGYLLGGFFVWLGILISKALSRKS